MKGKRLFVLVLTVVALCSVSALASVPWDKLPNVNSASLTPEFKQRAEAIMQNANCYAECPKSVHACVTVEGPTKTALRAAGFITRQVVRGKSEKEILTDLQDRARSVHPFKPATIDLSETPILGDASAPVQVVVFADFDCPFCKVISPILRGMIPSYGKVAYYFKIFPVKAHGAIAIETSKAGYAAWKLGKFWEFHDIMYKHFEDHDDDDIRGYVQQLGMDWDRFKALKDSDEAKKSVSDMKRQGLKLGVKSTPSIYINGKRYFGEKSEIEIKDRIEEELDLIGR